MMNIPHSQSVARELGSLSQSEMWGGCHTQENGRWPQDLPAKLASHFLELGRPLIMRGRRQFMSQSLTRGGMHYGKFLELLH